MAYPLFLRCSGESCPIALRHAAKQADRTISNGEISDGLTPVAFAAIVHCPSGHISDPFERSEVLAPRPPGCPFGSLIGGGCLDVRTGAAASHWELTCVTQVSLGEHVAFVKQVS
jgi:hypothetical protein